MLFTVLSAAMLVAIAAQISLFFARSLEPRTVAVARTWISAVIVALIAGLWWDGHLRHQHSADIQRRLADLHDRQAHLITELQQLKSDLTNKAQDDAARKALSDRQRDLFKQVDDDRAELAELNKEIDDENPLAVVSHALGLAK